VLAGRFVAVFEEAREAAFGVARGAV